MSLRAPFCAVLKSRVAGGDTSRSRVVKSALACRAVPCYVLAMKHISVADVIALPVAERLRLVEVIWDSIAEVPEQLELSPAQAQELDRRVAAFEKHPTQGSPWQEVRARLERTG